MRVGIAAAGCLIDPKISGRMLSTNERRPDRTTIQGETMFSTFRNITLAASVNGGSTVPLAGTVAHGSFSYDSSSIVPGGANPAAGLLTSPQDRERRI
jgi:hypothetical protein